MKETDKSNDDNKLIINVLKGIFENDTILNASYKFTDKCYINIEAKVDSTEIIFKRKENSVDLEKISLDFGNELIDQQIRRNVENEFKFVREQLLNKAFSSISQ